MVYEIYKQWFPSNISKVKEIILYSLSTLLQEKLSVLLVYGDDMIIERDEE